MTFSVPRCSPMSRPHDQHCGWCDAEEFMAMRYGSLHHVSTRVLAALRADHEQPSTRLPQCPECGEAIPRAGCVTCADGW